MKKIIVALVIICLCISLFGCKSSEYSDALNLFNDGKYSVALTMFESLGEYKSSESFVQECNFNLGIENYEQGNYDIAIGYFEKVSENEEVANYVKECKYCKALTLLHIMKKTTESEAAPVATTSNISNASDSEIDEAISILETLGDYKDSLSLIEETKYICDFRDAKNLFEKGDLSQSKSILTKMPDDYEDVSKYLTAIDYLMKLEGKWSTGSYFSVKNNRGDVWINPIMTVSGPYHISTSSFSDCDWGVCASIQLQIEQMWIGSAYGGKQAKFTIWGKECASHIKESEETELGKSFQLTNENYGNTIFDSKYGGYSKIWVQFTEDENGEMELYLTETPYSLDWTTKYTDGGAMRLYKSDN